MKKIIYLLICILLLGVVYALDECGYSVLAGEPCSIISPYISYCPSYFLNISYSNGTIFKDNVSISQIARTGIYNYSVNFTIPDVYVVKLCDDSVRSITALNSSAIGPSSSWWSYLLQIYYNTLPGAW